MISSSPNILQIKSLKIHPSAKQKSLKTTLIGGFWGSQFEKQSVGLFLS